MALFIHNENQVLLWNVISNMDLTKAIFVEGSPQKSVWFKNIIEEFYIKNYGVNMSTQQLKELNKQVIAYMVENLKTIYQNTSRSTNLVRNNTPMQSVPYQEPQTVYSRNNQQASVSNKSEEYTDQFSKRQQDYDAMTKKPQPVEINFTENIKDEPISNMEELIRQQQQQREYELNIIMQPKIQIQSENVVVSPDKEVNENSTVKKVSWSDETQILNELSIIKSQIAQLFVLMEELKQK